MAFPGCVSHGSLEGATPPPLAVYVYRPFEGIRVVALTICLFHNIIPLPQELQGTVE